MNRSRRLILLLGPVPLVAASLAVSSWRRSPSSLVSGNHVVYADEIPRRQAPRLNEPGGGDVAERIESYLSDECDRTGDTLRSQLGKECRILVRPPFVLAGNLSEAELRHWHDATIASAARAMANEYFRKPPTLPITILLFGSEQSYNRYAKQLFNEEGVSVYGYYKPDRRTLVMNISTGGGTLVHELTHALIAFDFPEVPDWFNEGLASLHEQCRFRPDDAGIEGLPNWRLPKLQQAARDGTVPPIERMMTRDDFRGPDVGLNYAQARYLCLYLQQHGKLAEFYRRFRAGYERDPRGVATLESLFDAAERQSLDREFQAWLLKLSTS